MTEVNLTTTAKDSCIIMAPTKTELFHKINKPPEAPAEGTQTK
jgi:hypothetical protein